MVFAAITCTLQSFCVNLIYSLSLLTPYKHNLIQALFLNFANGVFLISKLPGPYLKNVFWVGGRGWEEGGGGGGGGGG